MNTVIPVASKCFHLSLRNPRLFPQRSGRPLLKEKLQHHALSVANLSHALHRVRTTQESIKNPGQTVDLELSVIDTHPNDKDRPTVVGIHGNPGSSVDFEPLIQQLSEKNIRFVAPTFPGFESSEVEPWKLYHLDYTTSARMSLLEQVLQQRQVNRVSVLMCHSAGSWVGYKMAAESELVKSLCLLNPTCARPHQSVRPQFVIHFVAWLMRQQSLHFALMPLLEKAYAQIGFSGVKAGDHLMVAQQIVSNQNFEDTAQHAKQILEKQLPLLFAYALNDKIIESPVSEDMLFDHLCVPKDSVMAVDTERNQTPLSTVPAGQDGENRRFAQGLQFARGGHIVHKPHSHIILDRVLKLLAHVEGTHV